MVGPVKNDDSTRTNLASSQHRLQLLAQAIEKVENDCSQKKTKRNEHHLTPTESVTMTSIPQQELLMKLLAQQNMAAVMAAAAAAATQLQTQQKKPEPISPPSTSSASSLAESPIDFSSHRSADENQDGSAPTSPQSHQQLLTNMFQNLQSASSTSSFPFLLTSKNGKPTRPFKAYPRDPLMLPLGLCSSTGNPIEQTNLLTEAVSRSTSNRKRFNSTQERLKQRPQHQQQSYFISSTGAQILQPPKKRHRTMTNEDQSSTDEHQQSSSTNTTPSINNEETNNNNNDAYWERRRKNNEAAKRSRDARRAKEDEIAIRAALLEQENIKLRLEVSQLKQETAKLRCMVYAPS